MRPLILDFAVNRSQVGEVLFSYDNTLNLNVIKNNQKVSPYVDAGADRLEIATVTKVKNEGSDHSYNLLELVTKTDAIRERDDQKPNEALELITKTAVASERDDEDKGVTAHKTSCINCNNNFIDLETETRVSREGNDMSFDFLELQTKTFVKRERDDEQGII